MVQRIYNGHAFRALKAYVWTLTTAPGWKTIMSTKCCWHGFESRRCIVWALKDERSRDKFWGSLNIKSPAFESRLFQDGFKDDSHTESSTRHEKVISATGLFDQKPPVPGVGSINHIPGSSATNLKIGSATQPGFKHPGPPQPIGTPGPGVGPGYSNQWTASGEKKPLLDPSIEAAKYWQRVKEQGFYPQPVTPPAGKDQQAVESYNEFTEFDHHPFSNFPSEYSSSFDTQPFFKHDQHPHGQPPPHIVFERDHSYSYAPAPAVSYQPVLPETYNAADPETFILDEDGPERNALLYLSPHGPKVSPNCDSSL